MKKNIILAAIGLAVLTGCEYVGPRKPSKPHGNSKYKYQNLKKQEAKTPSFLKNFVEEEKEVATTSSTAPEATAVTLPNFKGDYLKKLRAKYPMMDIKKIEDKDLMGMLEIYSQELNKIKARLQ